MNDTRATTSGPRSISAMFPCYNDAPTIGQLVDDAYAAPGFDFSGTRQFDRTTGYRSRSFLTVPMKDHDNEVIAVLQLSNATDPVSGAVTSKRTAPQRQ